MAQCRKIGGRFAKKTERVCSEILRDFNGISEVASFRMKKEQYYSYLVCNFISFKVDHRHPNFHPDEVLDVVGAKARASEVKAIEDMLEGATDQRQPLTMIKSGGGYKYIYLCGVKVNKLLWDLVKHVGVEPGNGWVFNTCVPDPDADQSDPDVSAKILVFEAPFISGVVAGFTD
jgi:hypothetical protein